MKQNPAQFIALRGKFDHAFILSPVHGETHDHDDGDDHPDENDKTDFKWSGKFLHIERRQSPKDHREEII